MRRQRVRGVYDRSGKANQRSQPTHGARFAAVKVDHIWPQTAQLSLQTVDSYQVCRADAMLEGECDELHSLTFELNPPVVESGIRTGRRVNDRLHETVLLETSNQVKDVSSHTACGGFDYMRDTQAFRGQLYTPFA